MSRPRLILSAPAAAAVLLAAGCGDPASDPTSDGAQQHTADSLDGSLTVYTSQPDEDIAAMVDAFTAEHPDTEVEVFRSGTEEVLSRARAEHDNDALGGDVFLIADAVSMVALREEGMLAPYTSPEAEDIAEEFVDPEGHYTGTKLISTGIAYNTDAVDQAPPPGPTSPTPKGW